MASYCPEAIVISKEPYSMRIDGLPRPAGTWTRTICIPILTASLISAPAAAKSVFCYNPNVEVAAQTSEIEKEACTASELAIEFLSRYGLKTKRQIRISIVEQPIHIHSYSAYGSYDSRNDLVQVMSPQAIHQVTPSPQINNQLLNLIRFHGIVAHEVTHALILQNSQLSPMPVGTAAQEYLAGVTQMSIMPPEIRDKVIRSADVGPWESGDVISITYMEIAPLRFAVKSYLHFQKLPVAAKFVDELLRSKSKSMNVE